MNQNPPTLQAYSEMQTAYDFFNKELFEEILPPCLIIFYNKEKRTFGYYSKDQFINEKKEMCDLIAMNPKYFAGYTVESVMQTLVHEMCHLWQYHFGKPTRGNYHNKEWGDKMESIGLMPSNTGKEGGKKTGQQMMDYPIEGGLFQKACQKLLTQDFKITWYDKHPIVLPEINVETIKDLGLVENTETLAQDNHDTPAAENNKTNRIKYTCPECHCNVWGKPNLNLICGDCESEYEEA